jgi:hypothetical protein
MEIPDRIEFCVAQDACDLRQISENLQAQG